MPVTHDTEDRDVQHHDGSKVQGRGALVASWLRLMPEQILVASILSSSSLFSSTSTKESRDNPTSLGSSSKVSPGQCAQEVGAGSGGGSRGG